MLLKRLAALAEVLLVLALGNIVGEAIYPMLVGEAIASGSAGETALAFGAGFLILLRLGLAGAFGLLLLFLRTGTTPRGAGLSLNGQPLSYLLKEGLILGTISGLLISLLFLAHSLFPFGEGLPAWSTYHETPINLAFLVALLGTSILIPPLTEEIMTRGYIRVRIVQDFGPMAGVILTGIIFGLFHTRYISSDPMLALFLIELLFGSILWTYSAQRTGSIVPALVAHAMANGIGTAVLFDVWIPFIGVVMLAVLLHHDITNLFSNFAQDWRGDREKRSLWQGISIVAVVLITALVLLSQIGRSNTLITLGVACLIYSTAFFIWEKSRAIKAA